MTLSFDPRLPNVIALRPLRAMQAARRVAERPLVGRFVGENTGADFYRPGDTPATVKTGQTTEGPPA